MDVYRTNHATDRVSSYGLKIWYWKPDVSNCDTWIIVLHLTIFFENFSKEYRWKKNVFYNSSQQKEMKRHLYQNISTLELFLTETKIKKGVNFSRVKNNNLKNVFKRNFGRNNGSDTFWTAKYDISLKNVSNKL